MTASNSASRNTHSGWFLAVDEFGRIVLEPTLKSFQNKPDLSVNRMTQTAPQMEAHDELGSLGGMSPTVVESFPIAPATVADCRECAQLLVEQLGEHGVATSAEQLARMLECVVTDGSRGFLLLARARRRIVGVAYVATILSAEHCGCVGWLERDRRGGE